MSLKIKSYGQIKDGKLEIYGQKKFVEIISTSPDTSVEVTITKKYKKRSNQQNRYYWGCVVPIIQDLISEASGCSFDSVETHDFLKSKCNYIEIHNRDGIIEKIPQSTSELNTVSFEIYLDSVRKFAFEFFDVQIELPNEQLEFKI